MKELYEHLLKQNTLLHTKLGKTITENTLLNENLTAKVKHYDTKVGELTEFVTKLKAHDQEVARDIHILGLAYYCIRNRTFEFFLKSFNCNLNFYQKYKILLILYDIKAHLVEARWAFISVR